MLQAVALGLTYDLQPPLLLSKPLAHRRQAPASMRVKRLWGCFLFTFQWGDFGPVNARLCGWEDHHGTDNSLIMQKNMSSGSAADLQLYLLRGGSVELAATGRCPIFFFLEAPRPIAVTVSWGGGGARSSTGFLITA